MHNMAETPAFSLFPLSPARFLLFLLGYPAGASAEERGLDTNLISIDVFIAVYFSLAFVC